MQYRTLYHAVAGTGLVTRETAHEGTEQGDSRREGAEDMAKMTPSGRALLVVTVPYYIPRCLALFRLWRVPVCAIGNWHLQYKYEEEQSAEDRDGIPIIHYTTFFHSLSHAPPRPPSPPFRARLRPCSRDVLPLISLD